MDSEGCVDSENKRHGLSSAVFFPTNASEFSATQVGLLNPIVDTRS